MYNINSSILNRHSQQYNIQNSTFKTQNSHSDSTKSSQSFDDPFFPNTF